MQRIKHKHKKYTISIFNTSLFISLLYSIINHLHLHVILIIQEQIKIPVLGNIEDIDTPKEH